VIDAATVLTQLLLFPLAINFTFNQGGNTSKLSLQLYHGLCRICYLFVHRSICRMEVGRLPTIRVRPLPIRQFTWLVPSRILCVYIEA